MLPQNLPLNLPQNPPQDVPLQDVPPIPNIPPVPVQPPPPDPMIQLTEAIANLTAISTMHLANNVSGAKIVMRPTPFAGERGADVRRFLATFTMWAMVHDPKAFRVDSLSLQIQKPFQSSFWVISKRENVSSIRNIDGNQSESIYDISIPALYFLVLFSACTSQKSHKSQKATSKTR